MHSLPPPPLSLIPHLNTSPRHRPLATVPIIAIAIQTKNYLDGSVDQCRAEPYCYFIVGCKSMRGRDGHKETGTCQQYQRLHERLARMDFKPIEIKIGNHYDLVRSPIGVVNFSE